MLEIKLETTQPRLRIISVNEKPKTGKGAGTTRRLAGTKEIVQATPGSFRNHRKGGSTMKTMYTSLLIVNRAKWMLMGLVLAVVLLFPHQDATAGQAPVNLGSASSFALLAGTTITSTGGGTIDGDVGVSPGTAITGITPGMVSGTIYPGDPIAAQAQADLVTVFNDAAGRSGASLYRRRTRRQDPDPWPL